MKEKSCDGTIPLVQYDAENRPRSGRCGRTDNHPHGITESKWIFSREERVALATTEGTDKLPGGNVRLIHETEYKAERENVQRRFSFDMNRAVKMQLLAFSF